MKLTFNLVFTISLIAFLSACAGGRKANQTDSQNSGYTVHYAQGYLVEKTDDYTAITLRNPWDTAQVLKKYVLVSKDKELPANLPSGILVRTPLSRVIAYSTIHCSTLEELQSIDIVKGVCESQYIDIPYIKENVANGNIPDLGIANSPDIERLILLEPEAIFSTPIQGQVYGQVEKLGIPMIETPDYMENTPLGRAEWIRFYSLFLENESFADSLYNQTVTAYLAIKEKVSSITNRPTVFTDLMYGSVWYTAGGESFMANMLHDAGANYVWKESKTSGSTPLAFETVLDKAGDANFWLMKYNQPKDMTYTQLPRENKGYANFDAYKNRNIWGCNTGRITYYEDLPIHPDYILQDFAAIFHPELFPDYTLQYYSKLAE